MASAEDIRTDIDQLRAARLALAKGERVKEYWRDGRRVVFDGMTLDSVNSVIEALKADLADAIADEDGGPRRRAIGIRYSN